MGIQVQPSCCRSPLFWNPRHPLSALETVPQPFMSQVAAVFHERLKLSTNILENRNHATAPPYLVRGWGGSIAHHPLILYFPERVASGTYELPDWWPLIVEGRWSGRLVVFGVEPNGTNATSHIDHVNTICGLGGMSHTDRRVNPTVSTLAAFSAPTLPDPLTEGTAPERFYFFGFGGHIEGGKALTDPVANFAPWRPPDEYVAIRRAFLPGEAGGIDLVLFHHEFSLRPDSFTAAAAAGMQEVCRRVIANLWTAPLEAV